MLDKVIMMCLILANNKFLYSIYSKVLIKSIFPGNDMLRLAFTRDSNRSARNMCRHSDSLLAFVLTGGANDQSAMESAYIACSYGLLGFSVVGSSLN